MTTDEALAIAVERGWALVPIRLYGRWVSDLEKCIAPYEPAWAVMDLRDHIAVHRGADGLLERKQEGCGHTDFMDQNCSPHHDTISSTIAEAVAKAVAIGDLRV